MFNWKGKTIGFRPKFDISDNGGSTSLDVEDNGVQVSLGGKYTIMMLVMILGAVMVIFGTMYVCLRSKNDEEEER